MVRIDHVASNLEKTGLRGSTGLDDRKGARLRRRPLHRLAWSL